MSRSRLRLPWLVVLPTASLLSIGCAPLKEVSSGQTGCSPDEITISNDTAVLGARTWTAECRDQTYYCSAHASGEDGSQVSCTRSASETAAGAATPSTSSPSPSAAAAPAAAPSDYPEEALGFRFGASLAEAQEACVAGGHEWSPAGSTFRCKGAPSSIGATTDTYVGFCDGGVCLVALNVLFDESDPRADKAFRKIASALQVRYGTPKVFEPRIPQHCTARVVSCAASDDASWRARWVWSGRRYVLGELNSKNGKPRLLVKYSTVPKGMTLDSPEETDTAPSVDTSAF